MRNHLARSAMLAVVALAAFAPASSAATGSPVQITLDVNTTVGTETFTAIGAFCPSGTAESGNFRFAGGGQGRGQGFTFHLEKTLTCDNGSGTLTIAVDAATHLGEPTDQGGWSVISGTRDWSGASGGGQIVGTYNSDGIVDVYTGIISS